MARQIALILLGGLLAVVLAAIFFPVFAQSKQAAKRTAALSEYKRHVLEANMQAGEAKATLASYSAPTRSVIRKADLTLMVDHLDDSERSVKALIARIGGYVENASGWDLASITPSMKIMARVPEPSFEGALTDLERLGQRTAKSITAEDVTEQIVDMDARLKTMLTQEEVYRGMLRKVNTIGDATHMQDTLMKLREDIESMTAQRKSLATQAAMSTIEVTLTQKANAAAASSDPNWVSDAWNSAVSAATAAFHLLAVVGIWLAVFSPIWLAPCVIAFLVYRMRKRAPAA